MKDQPEQRGIKLYKPHPHSDWCTPGQSNPTPKAEGDSQLHPITKDPQLSPAKKTNKNKTKFQEIPTQTF